MPAAPAPTPLPYDREDHFLWHLRALGIARGATLATPLWDEAREKPPVRVAIIDTGVDIYHPNLSGAVPDDAAADFSSTLFGTIYVPPPRIRDHESVMDGTAPGHAKLQHEAENAYLGKRHLFAGLSQGLKARGVDFGSDPSPTLIGIIKTLEDIENQANVIAISDPSTYFGAHGTACAGLVGGRPPVDDAGKPRPIEDDELPYFGINPYCEIIPICTPYSHEILPVIHALLYAVIQRADIILMPRGVVHPGDRAALKGSSDRVHGSRITANNPSGVPGDQANLQVLNQHRVAFEELVKAISNAVYVVTAAGNDGLAQRLAYPASLAGAKRASSLENLADPGDMGPGFLVATARNRDGLPSSYANGTALSDLAIPVLSDDAFRFDEGQFRIDGTSQFAQDFKLDVHASAAAQQQSPWGLLSLDVSGPFGYEEGDWVDGPEKRSVPTDRRAGYTIFGGTSASCSVLAGCIALYLQTLPVEQRKLLNQGELLEAIVRAGIRLASDNCT
ncbi:S8 family serine peptidase [Rhodovulum strictum]